MIYKSIDLNKEFNTRDEMFAELKANKESIIALKKSVIYKSIDKMISLESGDIDPSGAFETKAGYIHPVINTTNFLDSHLDNHQKSIWNKSASDKAGKIRYSLDHSTRVSDVVAYPKDVGIHVVDTTFEALGTMYKGEVQLLVFDIKKEIIDNPTALNVINKRLPVQNSVSMRYITITLALNSEDKKYIEEKKEWDKAFLTVANKDFANEQGVMWLINQAEIVGESSMVTNGSNSLTPIVYGDKEAAKSTSETIEPPKGTQKSNNNLFLLTV